MKRTVTLQHIADRLHLSRTTISLALSDHPRIGQTTKDRVRALAARMGYEPDRIARSLATGTSSLIGVMVPDSTNAYYAEVIRGIEEAARSAQLGVVLANGSYDLEMATRIREMAQVRVAESSQRRRSVVKSRNLRGHGRTCARVTFPWC